MQLETIERTDGVQQVALSGSLDIEGTREIDIALHAATAAGGKPTVVDMGGVSFVSSIGMGLLVACAGSLTRKGTKMVLFNVSPEVMGVMEASRLTEVIPVADDEAAAVAMATA